MLPAGKRQSVTKGRGDR